MTTDQRESPEPELLGLRRTRKAYGLGLRELARLAEIDQGQLSRVERGLERPTWRLITRVARALDMPVPALLSAAMIGDDADE